MAISLIGKFSWKIRKIDYLTKTKLLKIIEFIWSVKIDVRSKLHPHKTVIFFWLFVFDPFTVQHALLQLAKFRALVDRCGPHLRELRFAVPWKHNTEEQWVKLGNLRHLRFDGCVLYQTLYAVAKHLKRLQSVHFSNDMVIYK